MTISEILSIAFSAAVAILTTFIIPTAKKWAVLRIELLRKKLDQEQNKLLDYWISVFVSAMESAYEKFPSSGEMKKEEVINLINKMGLPNDSIDERIDSMCRELKAQGIIY